MKILQEKQAHCKHLREYQTALNVNFNISAKEASNTTVQHSQVQKKDDVALLHEKKIKNYDILILQEL